MGDEHPWGPAKFTTWDTCYRYLKAQGMDDANAAVGAAVGTAESGLDETVLNNTPATGDYSVGIWQINYFGSLYAGRVAQFGTPRHLARSGVDGQSQACYAIWSSSGWSPWSTYNSGAYLAYLHGYKPAPGRPIGGPQGLPNPTITPPTGDYSATVRAGAHAFANAGNTLADAADVLHHLTRRYRAY